MRWLPALLVTLPAACGGGSAAPGDGGAPDGRGDGGAAVDAPACAGPPPPAALAIATGGGGPVLAPGPHVVLTGTLPPDVDGSPVVAVEVNGSARGVRLDPARGLWSFVLAALPPGGDVSVVARAVSGATAGPVTARVARVGAPALPARDLDPAAHTVGAWMFTWFTGDPGWQCGSPWRPVGGFAGWDGSAAWAREQLLDQMDAHLDLVGLQLDTITGVGPEAYRWNNVVHVLEAARGLYEEGFLPPRLFPLVDTAIVADHWLAASGSTLDLAGAPGRTYLYDHARAFWQAAAGVLGEPFLAAASARRQGRPYVALWHSVTMDGESDAAVVELKARFRADFGADPWLVAHPNDWRNLPAVDEITLMFGPPTHFYMGGRDGAGAATINIEAGFWNPISNPFYLPRDGGTHFDDAWQSALAARGAARRLYIDSWNETGEGSGIFAAEPVAYTAADAGPCETFANRHDDAWGASARHYIDVTRDRAGAWNDAPDLDAAALASDLPGTLRAGERRLATVVVQNLGDRTWGPGGPGLVERAGGGFGVDVPVAPLPDALAARAGGVARGFPAAFPVLLTAPCDPGVHTLTLGMTDPTAGAFGADLAVTIVVTE